MVAFYQHNIVAWMDGTESLEDGEYRAYHVICELMYMQEGPIKDNEKGIAGRCNQHVLTFRRNLRKLIDAKKIVVMPDGKLTNLRVEQELARIRRTRKPSPDPRPTSGQPQANPPATPAEPPQGLARKPLKTKDPDSQPDLLENTRGEDIDSERPKGLSAAAILEQRLFDRGKEVLGKNAGGMIARLVRAKGGMRLALETIEEAALKQDPREYVGAALRAPNPPKNGKAAAAMKALRESAQQGGCDDGEPDDPGHHGGEIIPAGSTRGDHAVVVLARRRR
jgi:hypothetical protein